MDVALLHYWLTNMRGGEKVLAALGEMFPNADIFTHAYIPEKVKEFGGHRVSESFVAKLPLGRKHPQMYLPFLPMASRALRLDGYDLVISSESGPIKGITKPKGTRHICYCHTPMRYIWDMYDEYYAAAGMGGKIAMRLFRDFMRKEDLKSTDSVDQFVSNSAFVAERIKRIYARDSIVVHPPVNVEFFNGQSYEKKDYYLYAGELRAYKRPDLAVRACLKMGRKLVVIGNGKMREALMKETAENPNIKFLGRVSDEELRQAYGSARALLFPGVEDFGIVPVEAQAAGTPVIALGKGGALETVQAEKTGLFFNDEKVGSLCAVIEEFESRTWDSSLCRANAERFTIARFKEGFGRVVGDKRVTEETKVEKRETHTLMARWQKREQ